ncbi:unnamed protein product, partial [Adineta steineri]
AANLPNDLHSAQQEIARLRQETFN